MTVGVHVNGDEFIDMVFGNRDYDENDDDDYNENADGACKDANEQNSSLMTSKLIKEADFLFGRGEITTEEKEKWLTKYRALQMCEAECSGSDNPDETNSDEYEEDDEFFCNSSEVVDVDITGEATFEEYVSRIIHKGESDAVMCEDGKDAGNPGPSKDGMSEDGGNGPSEVADEDMDIEHTTHLSVFVSVAKGEEQNLSGASSLHCSISWRIRTTITGF